jgi:ABC-type transporter Mla subunit MlaD
MAYDPARDPTLTAFQKLYSYGAASQSPDAKNNVNWQTNNMTRDASDQLDQQIKSLEEALKAMEDLPEGKSSQQYRQMAAQLDDLKQRKDAIDKTSTDAFWNYRPAGWTGEMPS